MEGANLKIGAAGSSLIVTIHPGAVKVPLGSLTPNMIPVAMSFKKPV